MHTKAHESYSLHCLRPPIRVGTKLDVTAFGRDEPEVNPLVKWGGNGEHRITPEQLEAVGWYPLICGAIVVVTVIAAVWGMAHAAH